MNKPIVSMLRSSMQVMGGLLALAFGHEAYAAQTCPVPPSLGLPWSAPSTWGGALPAAGAAVVIPAGKRIVLDIDPPPLKSITIEGQLAFDTTKDLNLSAEAIIVVGQGAKFEIGTPANPYLKRATITLTGSNPNENVMGMGTKVLGAQMGAVIEITGESRVMWTQLGATAAKGASNITLKEPVDWRVGDRIVIASSAMKAGEAEERFVTAVSGATVTLNAPLAYQHWGTVQIYDGKAVDQRAEVGLLSRNIVIQGDDTSMASKFGGHIMIMGSNGAARETNAALRASARVHGVELRRMGQFDRLGRYPFHWHFMGSAPNDFISGSAIHTSIQRGIVVHSSDDVTVRNNVVYNTPGHAYVVEDGTERRVTFERNLGLLPRAVTFANPSLKDQADNAAATYWLRTASLNFVGNTSAGGEFAGMWFDMSFIDGANATKASLTFRDNTVHSHEGGRIANTEQDTWAIWHTDGYVPSDEGFLLFDRTNAYKNSRAIETKGRGESTNSILADNMFALSQHVIRDSMVVSRTANTDTDPYWGDSGLFAYGGFGRADNVSFVNFNNGRRAITTLTCNIEFPRFAVSRIRLVNSDPQTGCGDGVTHDLDGTMSGAGGARKLISYDARSIDKTFGLITSACEVRAAAGFAVCPDYDYRALTATYPQNSGFSNTDWVIDIVREEDGNRVRPEHFRWMSYVVPGKSYRLEVRNASVPNDLTVYPLASLAHVTLGLDRGDQSWPVVQGAYGAVYDPAWATRSLLVYAAAPTTPFRVLRCLRDEQCEQNDAQWPVINPAASLQALQAQAGPGYVVDAASQRIYFKLTGEDRLRFTRQ